MNRFSTMHKRANSSAVSILKLFNGWHGVENCLHIESENTGAIVPVNYTTGLCYALRARLARLLKLERRLFNEQTVSTGLSVP